MSKLVLCLFLVQFLGANAQVQGSLRLVGSTSPNGGRLEVYINGHWGTVCDDSWGYNDARVACRQLGYTGVVTTLTSSFPSRSSSQRIWLDNVRCTGYESKLISCSHNGYGIEDCDHSEDVGIYCTARYSNGDIRLVGGNSYRGRVEVYYSGRWRTACYSGWDSRESTAVCKQLGYTGVRSTTSVYTSVSSSNKASVSCSSGASSLHSCSISLYCSNNYQPSVECTNSSNGDIRLVGGNSYRGRVEVYYSGQWRTACYSGWDSMESTAVCRQLGYTRVLSTIRVYTSVSSSNKVSVSCSSGVSSLHSCSISLYCSSRYQPSVECTNSSNGDIHLVGGNSYRGRVVVYYSGRWRTACYSGWDSTESTAVCKQLGYRGVQSTTRVYTSVSSSNKASVFCSSGVSSLHNCSISLYCSSIYQPSVVCTNSSNGDIRLVGGNSYRGRVEVYYSGQWRTACYSGWDSRESTAVCKQLGYTGVLSTTSVDTSVSSSNKASVSCSSGASSLHSCSISLYCSSSYQSYVECTNSTVVMPSQHSNGDARLVGGSSQYGGRVEVYYNGEWRTACYSGWDYDASPIVCKQLGYGLVAGVTSTYTGSSSGMVSVDCNGYETSLSECRISSYSYSCYYQAVVVCTNSNVYAPLVWTILIPLVCGLIVLCVLCVPCVVAYCLYRKKKPRASPVPGNTAEGTVRYTASDEQSRVGFPTLPSTDQEGEVQINYHSGDSGQIGVDTTVGPGLVVMDQPPEDIESPPPSIQQD